MDPTVFFAWQSDTDADTGRNLLGEALAGAAAAVSADPAVAYRPTVDQDTRGVPGSPPIVAAILRKIDQCSIFVADVTLTHIGTTPSRKAPNPNVLLELGYALHRLGAERIILVFDTTYGRPEELPFDLRGSRVVAYERPNGVSAATIASLTERLEQELRTILQTVPLPPDISPTLRVDLTYTRVRIESKRHDYSLHVTVSNNGPDVIVDWAVDLQFPRALLDPAKTYPIVSERSGIVIMRRTVQEHGGPLYPGDTERVINVDYFMDHERYWLRQDLFPMEVVARAFASDRLVSETRATVQSIQCF